MSQRKPRAYECLLGVDTGGTFTDFVVYEQGRLRIHKVLSTPDAPERAILQGIRELGLTPGRFRLFHGSTVATNAVLEGKGARTAYITNRGLGDVLTIGRQARPDLYDLTPAPISPPVPAELCLETGGRLGSRGEVIEQLTEDDLRELAQKIAALKPQAVAINLLFSFLDAQFERAIEAALPPEVIVSRSSDVLPEAREFERGITTWLNAYVGPALAGYLGRLAGAIAPSPLAVMQSSGETISGQLAARRGVHLLLSGPAGGLAGAGYLGRLTDQPRMLTFDMGGTSTDVGLIDGEPRLTHSGRIGPYPVGVPMVDMHTIGAGGGSIAYVDSGGLLQVGPESAGADPGPACYGRGGERPTVTDANLVLGRLLPDAFLGGQMHLDVRRAREAMNTLAQRLGCSGEQAAMGIVRIVDERMARALNLISVQRGEDPRDDVLTCFGGAGGLHVCALADAMDMTRALVPIHAGVLSALGMLAAPRGRQLSHALPGELASLPLERIESGFAHMMAQGVAGLREEGVPKRSLRCQRSVDLRYRGQSHPLTVRWRGVRQTLASFHALHQQRYGHRLQLPVELVNLRLSLRGVAPELPLAATSGSAGPAHPSCHVALCGIADPVPVWDRSTLSAGQCITGPALITETVSTVFVAPNWQVRADSIGNLLLQRSSTVPL